MDSEEAGLFDLPRLEPPARPARALRGRNTETWARTVTAEVTVVDADALHAALAEELTVSYAMVLETDPGGFYPRVVESVPYDVEKAAPIERLDAVAWLIWPSEGLDEVREGGAFRVVEVASEVTVESPDRGIASWTVTVQLRNVQELRRLAAEAHPEQVDAIDESLAVAWELAADPYQPIRSIPGIAWEPRAAVVEHLKRRPEPQST